MEMQRAAEYLCQLIAGIDPDTGEVLPGEHLLRRADVREALLTALQAMEEQERSGELPRNCSGLLNAGRPWTEKDRADLLSLYNSGISVEEIAARLDRSEAAINARLFYMGAGGKALPPELAHQGLPWYPEEIAALQWMFRQGRTHEEMAAELKRSVGVIRNRLDMLGLADDAQD